MDRPIVIDTAEIATRESRLDIAALLSMIDYLIGETRPIDEMSTACLVMARKSLASFADGRPNPQ
jgi:hypothetical protein